MIEPPTQTKRRGYEAVPADCQGQTITMSDTLSVRADFLGDEAFWDKFVAGSGGRRCDELLEFAQGIRNADYVFPDHKAVVELKTLETDPTDDERLSADILDSTDPRLILNAKFRLRFKKLLGSANAQIKETMGLMNSEYFGVFVLVNNSFAEITAADATDIINRELLNPSRFHSVHICIYIPKRLSMIDGREALPIGMMLSPHAREESIRFGGAFMNSLIDFVYG